MSGRNIFPTVLFTAFIVSARAGDISSSVQARMNLQLGRYAEAVGALNEYIAERPLPPGEVSMDCLDVAYAKWQLGTAHVALGDYRVAASNLMAVADLLNRAVAEGVTAGDVWHTNRLILLHAEMLPLVDDILSKAILERMTPLYSTLVGSVGTNMSPISMIHGMTGNTNFNSIVARFPHGKWSHELAAAQLMRNHGQHQAAKEQCRTLVMEMRGIMYQWGLSAENQMTLAEAALLLAELLDEEEQSDEAIRALDMGFGRHKEGGVGRRSSAWLKLLTLRRDGIMTNLTQTGASQHRGQNVNLPLPLDGLIASCLVESKLGLALHEVEEAERLANCSVSNALRVGSSLCASALYHRAGLRRGAGRVVDALTDIDSALGFARSDGRCAHVLPYLVGERAQCLVLQGRNDEATADWTEAIRLADETGRHFLAAKLLCNWIELGITGQQAFRALTDLRAIMDAHPDIASPIRTRADRLLASPKD